MKNDQRQPAPPRKHAARITFELRGACKLIRELGLVQAVLDQVRKAPSK